MVLHQLLRRPPAVALDLCTARWGMIPLLVSPFLEREEKKGMQYGLYFFMLLAVVLLASLGAAVALAALSDLREKLGR